MAVRAFPGANILTDVFGPGGMLLEDMVGTSSTDVYYYHGDRQGSVRALTSSTGAVSNTYTYDGYGKTLSSTGSVSNPFKYTGEYTDQESGFIYLRARYYDPESQQFLTVDPALAWTEEAYAYVGGNPINLRDPWGLDGCGMFPNIFDPNSCVRRGLGTPAGPWVMVGGVALATGGLGCLVGGCEAIAVALGIGAVAVEAKAPAIVNDLETASTEACALTANSPINRVLLSKQLASESLLGEAQGGVGRIVAGAGSRRATDNIQLLLDNYGGDPADWQKMSTRALRAADGTKMEIHWYQNNVMGLIVEFKTKLFR